MARYNEIVKEKTTNVLIFCPFSLANTLQKAVEVNPLLILGINWDDAIFLKACPVSRVTTRSVDESGGSLQLLQHDESRLVGGMVQRTQSSNGFFMGPGLPFLIARISPSQAASYSPDPHGELRRQVQGDLSKPCKCSLFTLLCAHPFRNWSYLKCVTQCVHRV